MVFRTPAPPGSLFSSKIFAVYHHFRSLWCWRGQRCALGPHFFIQTHWPRLLHPICLSILPMWWSIKTLSFRSTALTKVPVLYTRLSNQHFDLAVVLITFLLLCQNTTTNCNLVQKTIHFGLWFWRDKVCHDGEDVATIKNNWAPVKEDLRWPRRIRTYHILTKNSFMSINFISVRLILKENNRLEKNLWKQRWLLAEQWEDAGLCGLQMKMKMCTQIRKSSSWGILQGNNSQKLKFLECCIMGGSIFWFLFCNTGGKH